jgi:hypothetical protein
MPRYLDVYRDDAVVAENTLRGAPADRLAFAGGLLFFGELNGWQKLPAVLGVLAGIILTVVG